MVNGHPVQMALRLSYHLPRYDHAHGDLVVQHHVKYDAPASFRWQRQPGTML